MHYFALLLSPENARPAAPAERATEMAAYQNFHELAARFIRGGDALAPSATGARVTGGPDHPSVTDGPFAEGSEVAGGFYVFEADNLDEALELAGQIPAAKYGAVEIWPMVHWSAPTAALDNAWLALLLESPDRVNVPGSPEWEARSAEHVECAKSVGDHFLGGAPLHPPAMATTVTVRDGKVSLTDGPFVEGAEVANGFYLVSAADRDEAIKIATMIPAGAVELRQLAGVSGL